MTDVAFDTIGYIPKFYRGGHNIITKKIAFEVVLFLGMQQVTKPYVQDKSKNIKVAILENEIPYGSIVQYESDQKGYGTYLYQSPKGLRIQSDKSVNKGILTLFLKTYSKYLMDVFNEQDRSIGLQKGKQLFEIILRCGLKKRRHLIQANQHFVIHNNGYLIDTKNMKYIHSIDNYITDSEEEKGSIISRLTCAEYLGRELRNHYHILLDECSQFTEYAGKELFEQGIAQLATHGIEIIELQKHELHSQFINGKLKDEWTGIRNYPYEYKIKKN